MKLKTDIKSLLREEPCPNEMCRILEEFTFVYKSFPGDEIEMREAACIRAQLPGRVRPVRDNDLFAGRLAQPLIGFTPQSVGSGLGYCVHPEIEERLSDRKDLSPENRSRLNDLLEFWKMEGSVEKSRREMPESVKEAVPSERYYQEAGIAFSLYRMSGIQLDYRKLLKLGITGLKKEIAAYMKQSPEARAVILYEAMESALDSFSELAEFYALQCREMAKEVSAAERRKELDQMAEALEHIAHKAPRTFREGLQLMYLYNAYDGTKNYGRMDDYLDDLYHDDLLAGRIDQEEAIRLLGGIWSLMKWRDNRYDTRLIIGGRGRHKEEGANVVARLILECTRRVRENVPQVALRFHRNQDPGLYQKGLDMLAEGNTYPMLYNDDVNIPSAQKAFGVSAREAEHIIQYGCGEYVLNHRSVGTPSGVINLAQALIITLNKGKDPSSGSFMGMPPGRYAKFKDFNRFEDLMHAYREQVEYHVAPLAMQEYLEYRHAAEDNAYLTSSILMDDCLSRGKAIFDGGIRHLGGTLETYGNTNVADSLVAIRELVYEKQAFSLEQLRVMLKADFEGYEIERKMILDCPKYGNDNETADGMFTALHDHICRYTAAQAGEVGLDSYLVVIINNDANTVMGTFTSASPDGRRAFTHLNPGHSPSGGADRSGITACLNSLVKPDTAIHAGAVQNMKFSREVLKKHRPEFEALMDVYFQNGGAQAMLNVLSRGELEEARKYPEKYQNLIVRVGGFSERFVNLPPETQEEILSRTLN